MENSTKVVLREVQYAFYGEAERVGLESVVDRKFPSKMIAIEKFLTALSYELVDTYH